MSRPTPLQWGVRRARRFPGYRRLRRTVLGRLRGSKTARDIVTRIFAGSSGRARGVPRTFPPPGTVLGGIGTDQLPVAMISVIDLDADAIDEIVDDVARLQILTAAFRPVFILDRPLLHAPRRYGYAVELLIPQDEWRFANESWQQYASRRLADIRRRYIADTAIVITGEGMTKSHRVMLGSLASTS